MDAHFEVMALRGYVDGITALCDGDDDRPLTGFNVMMLFDPVSERLKNLEKILAKEDKDAARQKRGYTAPTA